MIIQKTGVLKYLRYLGVFCAITMGFFSIVATSEDDVKDALDITFDKDFDLTVEPITVDKVGDAGALSVDKCEVGITVNDGIAAAAEEYPDLLDVDIEGVTLNALEARYHNSSALPVGMLPFQCEVSLTEVGGDGSNDITVGPFSVAARAENDWSDPISLTPADVTAINYYLENRDVPMDLCVICNDNGIDSLAVTVEVNFDVNIEGEL